MLFEGSNARDGSACSAAPASSLTRMGVDHERPPSEDIVKSMSSPVVAPDQPANARYTTPFVPAAIEGDGRRTKPGKPAGRRSGRSGRSAAPPARPPRTAQGRPAWLQRGVR